jgi:hypothetical protein
MSDVTNEGERLIKNWLAVRDRVSRAHAEVTKLEKEERDTRKELAKWLKPMDATPGEKIAVWYGDTLVQVHVQNPGFDDIVTVRQRGKALAEIGG